MEVFLIGKKWRKNNFSNIASDNQGFTTSIKRMNRLFGVGGSKEAPITLTDATGKLDTRIQAIDGKVKYLDEQIAQVQKQLTVTRPGSTTRDSLRAQARSLLTQRRSLQAQRQQLQNQSLNLFQMDLATSNVRDAQDTMKAMQGAKKELQRAIGRVDPEMVQVLGEDVSELVADSWEVQELLGRSYAVDGGVGIGDEELEEELRMLEQQTGDDGDMWDRVLKPEDVRVDLPLFPTSPISSLNPTTNPPNNDDFYQNKN